MIEYDEAVYHFCLMYRKKIRKREKKSIDVNFHFIIVIEYLL